MTKRLIFILTLTAFYLCGCTASDNVNSTANMNAAASPAATLTPARGVVTGHDDRQFAIDAARGGMEEVELGKLATQKGQNPDVKRFGQRMVADHTKANAELKQVAASKGIELPATVSETQKQDIEKLSKLSGAEFDRQYMAMMVDDHDKDVADFGDEAKNGSDAQIKAFAAKILPTLQEHQRMAHEIKDKLK